MQPNTNKLEYDPKTHGIYLKKDFLPVSKSWYITVINSLSDISVVLLKYPQFNQYAIEIFNSIPKMKKYLNQHD
jgi:hypothetical protein